MYLHISTTLDVAQFQKKIGYVANDKKHDAITNVKKLFILWNLPDLTMMMLPLLLLRLQPTINNHIRHNCFLNHHLFCVYTICSGLWLSFLQINSQFDTFIGKMRSLKVITISILTIKEISFQTLYSILYSYFKAWTL